MWMVREYVEYPHVLYPGLNIQEQSARAIDGGAPISFRKVKLHRCQPNLVLYPGLIKIQELVGEGRFTMEASDLEQWERMNQIDWNTDE